MSLVDVATRIKEIQARGTRAGFGSPQPEEALTLIEKSLGVSLPTEYRSFVQRYGYVHIADVCVSGIYKDDPLEAVMENVVFATRQTREALGIPGHLLVIRRDHEDHGHAICLDLRVNPQHPPVVCWIPSTKKTRHWYSSFEQFLDEHILAGWEDA